MSNDQPIPELKNSARQASFFNKNIAAVINGSESRVGLDS
jgi:hypothetical protein